MHWSIHSIHDNEAATRAENGAAAIWGANQEQCTVEVPTIQCPRGQVAGQSREYLDSFGSWLMQTRQKESLISEESANKWRWAKFISNTDRRTQSGAPVARKYEVVWSTSILKNQPLTLGAFQVTHLWLNREHMGYMKMRQNCRLRTITATSR